MVKLRKKRPIFVHYVCGNKIVYKNNNMKKKSFHQHINHTSNIQIVYLTRKASAFVHNIED